MKHGQDSVMDWNCIAGSGKGSVIFNGDKTLDGRQTFTSHSIFQFIYYIIKMKNKFF